MANVEEQLKHFESASLDQIELQIAASDSIGDSPVAIVAKTNNAFALRDMLTCKNGQHFINAGNLLGITPLMVAAKNQHYANIRFLLMAGADIHAKDSQGETVLHKAAQLSTDAICRLLIKHGADVNALNRNKETPLHLATNRRDHECAIVIDTLINAGASVSPQDMLGDTPLHLAVESGNKPICFSLIEAGADIKLANNQGLAPDQMPLITAFTTEESRKFTQQVQRTLRKKRIFRVVK